MLIYLHGFRSAPTQQRLEILKKIDKNVIAPFIEYNILL